MPGLSDLLSNPRRLRQFASTPGNYESALSYASQGSPARVGRRPASRASQAKEDEPNTLETGEVIEQVQLPDGSLVKPATPSGRLVKAPGKSNLYLDPTTGEPYQADPSQPTGLRSAWNNARQVTKDGKVFKTISGVGEREIGVDPKVAEDATKATAKREAENRRLALAREKRPYNIDRVTGEPVPLQSDEEWAATKQAKAAKLDEAARVKRLKDQADLLELDAEDVRESAPKPAKEDEEAFTAAESALSQFAAGQDMDEAAAKYAAAPATDETSQQAKAAAENYLAYKDKVKPAKEAEAKAQELKARARDIKRQILDPKTWKAEKAASVTAMADDDLVAEVKAQADIINEQEEQAVGTLDFITKGRNKIVEEINAFQEDRRLQSEQGLSAEELEALNLQQARLEQSLTDYDEHNGEAKAESDAALKAAADRRDVLAVAGTELEGRAAKQAEAAGQAKAKAETLAKAKPLYEGWAKGLYSDDWRTEEETPRLAQEAAKAGLDVASAKEALQTYRQLDWSNPRRDAKTGQTIAEEVRTLPDGNVTVNPTMWGDADAYKKAVDASQGTPEGKAKALEAFPKLQEIHAEKAVEILSKSANIPGADNFMAWRERKIEEDQATQGKLGFARQSPAKQAIAYMEEMKNRSWFRKAGEQVGLGLLAGFQDIATQALGVGAMVTGSETLADLAAANTENTQSVVGAQSLEGSDTDYALRVMGMGARMTPAVAAMIAGAGAVGGGLTTASILAGGQTAGSMFADLYRTAKEDSGLSHGEAWKKAALPAALAGTITGLLTKGMGATGLERVFSDTATQETARNTFKAMLGQFVKGAAEELPEEIADEYFTTVLQESAASADPVATFKNFANTLPELAGVTALMGGAGALMQARRQAGTEGPGMAPNPEEGPAPMPVQPREAGPAPTPAPETLTEQDPIEAATVAGLVAPKRPNPIEAAAQAGLVAPIRPRPQDVAAAAEAGLTAPTAISKAIANQIAKFNPTGATPLPQSVAATAKRTGRPPAAVARQAAAGVVKIAQGQSLESLDIEEQEALGFINKGGKPTPDTKVTPLVYLYKDKPVLRNAAAEWLTDEAQEGLAGLVNLTEAERKAQIDAEEAAAKAKPAASPTKKARPSEIEDWDWTEKGKVRRRATDEWFEEGMANEDVNAAFERAHSVGGENLATHGMAKYGTLSGAFDALMGLLQNNVDPTRGKRGSVEPGGLDVAPLTVGKGSAAAMAGTTGGGTSYRDGPFILVQSAAESKKGKGIKDMASVSAILVNDANAGQLEAIRREVHKLRPDIIVELYSKADEVARQLNQPAKKKAGQAAPAKAESTPQAGPEVKTSDSLSENESSTLSPATTPTPAPAAPARTSSAFAKAAAEADAANDTPAPTAEPAPAKQLGKGAIIKSDVYRSEGDITITGDPVYEDGEWKHPALTQGGRTFKVAERFITSSTPAPAASPTGLSPAQEARATPEQKARAAKKPKQSPPSARRAFGKGAKGGSSYANFQSDTDADAYDYAAKMGKAMSGRNLSDQQMAAEREAAKNKLARVSAKMGIPEAELRSILTYYTAAVREQAKAVAVGEAFTPPTLAEFIASQAKAAPVEARPEPAQTQARPQGGQTEEAKEFRRVTNQSIQLGELAQQSRDAKVARQTEAEQRLQSLSDADLLGMDKNELNDLHADLTRGLGHPYPDKQVLLRQLNKLRQPAQAGQEEASQPAPAAKPPEQMTPEEWRNNHFDENEDRGLPADYFADHQFNETRKNKTQVSSVNGIDFLTDQYGGVHAFDGEKNVGYGDGKAFVVEPAYQRRGIGTEIIAIAKKELPTKRIGSQTAAGQALVASFHKRILADATKANSPVNAAAVDAYGIALPEGYTREGDLYVYRPAPSPAPASQLAGQAEATSLEDGVFSYLQNKYTDKEIIEIATRNKRGAEIVRELKKEGLITKSGEFKRVEKTDPETGEKVTISPGRDTFEFRWGVMAWELRDTVEEYEATKASQAKAQPAQPAGQAEAFKVGDFVRANGKGPVFKIESIGSDGWLYLANGQGSYSAEDAAKILVKSTEDAATKEAVKGGFPGFDSQPAQPPRPATPEGRAEAVLAEYEATVRQSLVGRPDKAAKDLAGRKLDLAKRLRARLKAMTGAVDYDVYAKELREKSGELEVKPVGRKGSILFINPEKLIDRLTAKHATTEAAREGMDTFILHEFIHKAAIGNMDGAKIIGLYNLLTPEAKAASKALYLSDSGLTDFWQDDKEFAAAHEWFAQLVEARLRGKISNQAEIEASQDPAFRDRLLALLRDFVAQLRDIAKLVTDKAQAARIEAEADAVQAIVADMAAKAGLEIQAGPEAAGLINTRPLEEAERNARKRLESLQYPSVGGGKSADKVDKLRKEYAQEKASRQADLDTASAKLKAAYAQNEAQPAPQAKPAQASQTDEADKALAEAFTGLFLPPSGLRLKQTRAQLIKATEDSSDWKDWYQRHEDTLTEFFGVDADLFQRILSVTSQAASVKANVGLALKAYVQLKTGAPFEGYLPAVIKNLQRVKDAAQVQGQKIAAYQQANTGADEVVVVDRHISRMLFGVDSPTAKQFQKGQQVLTQIANVLGWQPRQVQAAMWAASIRKAGNTPESYDSYLRELNKRGTLNDRIGSVVPTGIQNQRSGGSGGLDSTGSNQASLRLPPQGSLEQTDLPRDRRDAMMKAASVLVDAGVKTPAELAARLDKLAPGGQLRQYSRAFWRLMTGFDSTLEEKPDWQAVYQASPAPVAAKADQTLWADLSRFFASENSDGSRAAALKDLKAGTASDDAKGYLIDLLANPNYKGTAKSLAPQLIARLKATMPPATSPEAPTTAEANVPVTAEMVSKWFRAYYGGNAPVTKVLPGLFKIGDSLYGLYSVNKLTDQQVLNGVPFGDSQMLIKEEETAEEVPALPASVTPAQAEAVAEEAAMPEPAKQAAPFDAAAAKGQKKFLLAEVAAAVKAAPKRADMTQEQKDAITNLEDKFRNWDSLNEEERKTYASELAAAKADAERLIGYVTIEVPGDGTFTILNEKEALYRFQKKADKFPVSQAKDDLPAKPTAQAPTAVPALKKAKTTADVVAAVFPMVSTDTTRGEGLQKVKGEGAYLWATNGRFAVRVEHENGGGKGQEAIVYDEKGNAQPWPEGEQNPTMEAIIPDDKAFTPYTLDTARWFSLMSQARAIIKELPNESSTASKAVSLYRNPDGSLGLFASDINRGDYAHNIQPEAKILAAYSPDYFQTVLRVARNLGNEQIELRIGDDVSPATLRAGKALFVLMPMRVNGAPAYSTARPAPPVTAEASPAAPKAAKPRPMNMAGQVRPEKKKAEKFTLPPQEPFKPTAERFAQFYRDYSIPEDVAVKNGEKMMEAIETGEWTNLLHPDNKRSRAIWEAWTRQKLPAGVKASEDAFAKFITEYHATSNPVADLTEEELGRELLRLGPLALKPYASPATKARALALAQENQRRLASASPAAEPPAQPGQTREEAAEAARVFAGKDPSLPPPAPDDLETLQALRDRANRKPYKPDKLTPARLAVGIRAGWVTKTKEAKLTEKGYSQLSEWEQQQNAHERALGAIADKLVDEAVSKWDRENDPTSWEAINAAKQAAAQPGQEAAQPAQAPAPEGQGGQVKPITGFDSARAFIAQLRKGEVTAEQVRTAWAQLKAQRPAILADLNKMKVDELLPMAGMSARKSDGKASIAESVLSTLDLYFNPDDSISYSYGGDFQANKDAAMDEKVAKWTDEMIVEQAKARREAAEASKAAKEKALTNPETPEEWDRFVWSTGRKAMSEAEVKEVLKLKSSQARNDAVRKKGESVLTPEQLAAYDAVRGIDRKAQEQARTEAKARVYGVASGVEADIIETKHTQKGHDLFVVKLSERVERPVYDSLNAASKKLGGYYSSYAKGGAVPGFQFTTRAAAENFIAVSKGETVDQKEQIQERQEAKKSATASRLTAVAEVLDGKADGILNADRKTNTAKRAREAAGQEATARGMKAMAQTMRNLAAAMESGEATHLDGVRMGTHVETLDGMARGAMTYWIRDRKMGMMDREKTEAGGPTAEMMDATRIPYPYLDKGDILRLVEKGRETPGAKLLAERVAKIRMNENEGQAVTLRSDSEMDDVKELAQKVTERGKPVWDTIKWKYETYDRLKAMGLTNLPSLRAALREFLQYRGQAAKEDPIKKMERELVGMKLPGFFPTPRAVIDEMVGIAGIEPGMKVLEPSAGKGDIAEAMQEAGAEVDAIELSNRLRDILTAKGVNVIDNDFTSVEPEPKYDAVVMNPPFENGQDMEHIRHAYKFLKPGGKLVAIMSAGPFYRQDKQATAFREWLDSVGGSHEAMPEGSFAGSDAFRQTGVRTQMVTITKPADEGQPASLALPPAGQAVTAGRDATDTETLYQRLLKKYDEEIDPRPVADFDADQSPITVEFAGKKWEISIRDKTFLAEDVEDSDNGYNAHLDKELTVYQDASWGNVPRNISDIWEEAPGSWWQVPTVDSKDRDTWDAEQPYYAVETNDGESGWMDEEQVTLSLHDAVKMYVKESSEDKRLVYYTGDTTRGKDRFGDWDDIPKLEILAQPSFVEKLQRDFPGMTREEAIDIAKTRNTDNTDTFLVAQAYARHNYTDYDDRLKNARNLDEDTSRERSKARFELRESIQAVMERWTNTSSDESGQVIPLSERFNPASQSILRNPPAPEGGPAASQEASQPEADEEADPDLAAFMAEQQRLAEEEAAAREALRNDPDAIDAVQASGKMSARNLSKQFEYPEARAVYQALTAARDQLGGPETVQLDKLREWAKKTFESDPEKYVQWAADMAEESKLLDVDEQAVLGQAFQFLTREARLTGDKNIRALLNKVGNYYLDTGTRLAQAMSARRDPLESPQERWTKALDIVFGPSEAVRRKLRILPTQAGKARRIASLEAELAEARGSRRADVEAALKTARAQETKEELLEKDDAESEKIKQAVLKNMGVTEDDLMLSGTDRVALQSAILDLPAVKEGLDAYKGKDNDGYNIMRLAFRGFSDEHIANYLNLNQDDVGKFIHDATAAIIRPAVAAQVKAGTGFGGLIKAGFARLKKAVGLGLPPKIRPLEDWRTLIKGKKQTLDQVTAEVNRVMGYALQSAKARNSRKLMSKVINTPNGQKVRVFVPFDPDDMANYYAFAREYTAAKASAFDKVYEYWINWPLLSGPQTQVANITGNAAQVAWHYTGQRLAEATLNLAYQDPNSAQFREFKHILKGFWQGIGPAFEMARETFLTEGDTIRHKYLGQPLEIDVVDGDLDKVGNIRASVGGQAGRISRLPGRVLRFTDAFFKTAIMYAEASAVAYRRAHVEAKRQGLKGQARAAFIDTEIANTLNDTSSAVWGEVMKTAEELLFQDDNSATEIVDTVLGGYKGIKDLEKLLAEAEAKGDSDLAAKLQKRIRSRKFVGSLMRWIFPFQRTPTNIVRTGIKKAGGSAISLLYGLTRAGWLAMGKKGVPVIKSYPKAMQIKDASETLLAGLGWLALASMLEGDDNDDEKPVLLVGTRSHSLKERAATDQFLRKYGGENSIVWQDGKGKVLGSLPFGRYEPAATLLTTWIDAYRNYQEVKRLKSQGENASYSTYMLSSLVSSLEDKSFLQGFANAMQFVRDVEEKRENPDQSAGVKMLMNNVIPNLIKQPLRNMDDVLRERTTAGPGYAALPNPTIAPKLPVFAAQPKISTTGERLPKAFTPPARLLFQANTKVTPQPDALLYRANRLHPTKRWSPQPLQRDDYNADPPGKAKPVPIIDPAKKRQFAELAGRLYAANAAKVAAKAMPSEKAAPGESLIKAFKKAREDAMAAARAQAHAMGLHKATATP